MFCQAVEAISKDDSIELRDIFRNDEYDPNSIDPMSGKALLHIASEVNSVECLKVLLECGADPNIKCSIYSRIDGRKIVDGTTALFHVESVCAAKLLVEAGANINEKDGLGRTALFPTAETRSLELVNYFMEEGVDVSVQVRLEGGMGTILSLIDEKIMFSEDQFGESPNAKQKKYIQELKVVKDRLAEGNELRGLQSS